MDYSIYEIQQVKYNTDLFLQNDFADNREFIALLVYDTGGKKIFYPRMYIFIVVNYISWKANFVKLNTYSNLLHILPCINVKCK